MASEAYGQGLSRRVHAERVETLGPPRFGQSGIAVTRTAWEERREPHRSVMPLESAFLLCLELRDLARHPYWVDGKATEMPRIGTGEFTLLDLRQQHGSEVRTALDRLVAYLPASALTRFAEEHEAAYISEFRISPGQVTSDPVLKGLLGALLPALKRPQEASPLFLDHLALALIAYMTSTYGVPATAGQRSARGGLAAWQERRAKEALEADLTRDVRLQELAALCGLSRSHFARAFKQSTGVPPHRWLTTRRVSKAQDLLMKSTMTLEQIGAACGFADQGHFSRVFSKQIGIPPSAWRRLRRF